MRTFLVVTILLLGLSGAAPEREYVLRADGLRVGHDALNVLVEIESSTRRGDRLRLAALGPRALRVEVLRPEDVLSRKDGGLSLRLSSLDPEAGSSDPQSDATPTLQPRSLENPTSLDNLCNTLFTSAQDNDLPVPFFANLLWQESRLRADDVSKKGAQGIAQFMPKTAVETGLANPFDPMQAIPASARFLQRLRLQFGNLGFVAAAYNAGPHRVIEWLERRASLPRETRDYVVRVTGLSVEAWKTKPIDNGALTFVPRLPCRSLPAFANVEQEQLQQTELQRAQNAQKPSEEPADVEAANEPANSATSKRAHDRQAHDRRSHVHEAQLDSHESESSKHASKHQAKHLPTHVAREGHPSKHEAKQQPVHVARESHTSKHEAAHTPRAGRERHRSA